MIRFLKIAVLSFSFLFISNWLFGQASVVNNGNFPRHETLDQHTIEVRFTQAITGTATATDWTVRINGTPVTINSATRINSFDVAIVFQASDVNPGQNFLLPGQTLSVRFINSSGSITTLAGGAPANSSGGFITSVNKVVADCSDIAFLQQGLITLPVAKTPDICSPVVEDFTQYQYYLSLRVRNSAAYAGGNLIHQINWGDGVTTNEVSYTSDSDGVPSAAFYVQTAFGPGNPGVIMTSRPTHNYPATLPLTGGDCSWNATVTPVLNFAAFTACSGETKTTNFATYDTDNKNTGALNLPPFPLPTSNLVCRGTNVGMQFSDNTLLNCRLAVEPTVPNQRARAIRFTYGSTNFGGVGNVPDIRITLPTGVYGAQPSIPITNNDATGTLIYPGGYFPTNLGPSDGNGVIILPASVTVATALTYAAQITTLDPTKQVVGQRFYIRMEYWDVCNPYDPLSPATLANAESIENYVEIITKPTTPVANNKEFCAGTTLNPATATCAASTAANQLISFELTAASVTGSTAINWYFGNPASGGVLLTNSYGTNCRFFRSGALSSTGAQGSMRSAMAAGTPGVYSLWATYSIANGCISDPVEAKLTVRPTLTAPAAPTGIGNICNGSSAVYTLASAPLDRTIPTGTITNTANVVFPTEYLWTGSAADVTFGTNPSTVDNITATFNIATQPPTSTPRGIGAALQYRTATNNSTNNRCTTTPNNNLTVNVFGVTVGGTVSADQSICNGSPFATLTLTGQRGNVIRWERTGPGGLATISHTGTTLTSATEPFPPNGPGVYTYYAVLQNASGGPCGVVNSAPATITVNPIPPKPTITQGAGSAGLAICENGADQVVLQSDNVGGIGVTYKWFKGATLVQNSSSNTLTLDTSAESGSYTVQLVGPAPTACPGPLSDPVAVVISPLPTVSNATGGGAVCSGLPAPDIQFTFTGATNFDFTIEVASTPDVPDIVVTGHTSNTYTIVAPNPTVTTTYRVIALKDGNGCVATVLGGTRTVTIGGTAPTLDTPPSLSPVSACDDGAATTNPQLSFSLDAASASTNGFTLNYTIDGSAIRSKTFNTNAAGDPTAPIIFADTELNNSGPHTVRIVSIVSPATCQRLVNIDLSFTVNPRPAAPTGATNNTVCSDASVGVPLSVADPGFGFEIAWSTGSTFAAVTAGDGTVGGSRNSTFTPAAVAAVTFYAFKLDLLTSCLSSTGVAVQQQVDVKPTAAAAGADQPFLCGTTATMAATAADNGGTGNWTVVTPGYPGISITNTHLRNTTVTNLPQDVPNGSPIAITLKWTVASNKGVCATTDDDVVLTINPLPKALDPAPVLCADVAGGTTVSGVVLSSYNDRVTDIGGSTNRTVTYYSNSARTVVVSTPQTFATGQVFYTRVQDATTGCSKDGIITFTVESLPAAVPNKVYQFCENTVGSSTASGINLVTLVNPDIRGGAPATAANRLIEWFEDAAFTTPIPSGSGVGEDQNYTLVGIGTKTIYARVTNLSSAATTPSGTPSRCTNTTSVDLILNARPLNNPIQDPSGATPASITLCKSVSPLLFKVDATVTPGSTYTWSVPTGPGQFQLVAGGGTNSSNFFVLVAFPNQVSPPGLPITVQETINGCPGNIQTITVIVDDSPPAPTIIGPNNVCENQTGVNFQIATPNPTSTYTWTLPPLAVISGGNASKSSIFVDFNVFPGDVTVTESNTTGCTSLSAAPHPVNMFARPLITSGNTTVCSGVSPSSNGYVLTSSIGGSTFNWQVVSITGSVIGTAIGNTAINSQLTESITNISGSTAFVTYRVTPIGPAPGNCSGPTTDIVVTINPQPIITSPTSNIICSKGTVAPFTADVIGTTFTWTVINVTGSVSGTAIGDSGAGNINQTLVNTSGANAIVTYRVVPKSPPPCIGAFQDIDVTIISEPVITSLPSNEICSGNTPTLTFTSNVPGSTFSWTVIAKDPAITGTTIGSAGSGNINQTLSNTSGAIATVTYRVIPTGPSPNNCVGDFQDVVITVNPQPVITSPSTAVTCSGFAPTAFAFTSNLSGSTFSWTVTNITGTISGTALGNTGTGNLSEVITNTSGTNATVTYRVVPVGPAPSNCPGTFQDVVLTIAPQPVMTSAASNTICGGGVPTLVFSSNIPGSTFGWKVTGISGTVGGTAVGDSGSGNINQTLTNISGSAATVTYEVIPTGPNPNNCAGAPQVVTINVIPQPGMTSLASNTICSGSTPGIVFTSDVPGSTFAWTVTAISGGVTGTSIGNTGSGNILQTLTNVSGVDGTVTYQVIPTSPSPDNCIGFPQDVVITVISQPAMSSSTTNTICSGLAPTLVFNSTIAGSTFAWEVIAKSGVIGGATIGNTGSGNISQVLTNTSGVNGTVTYRVTPTGPAPNNCVGAFQDVVITINPEPVMTSAVAATICSGRVPGITFTANVASSTFAWKVTGITGTVGGAAFGDTGSGNISQILTNLSGTNATVTYEVTPTGPGPSNCPGAAQTVVVTVVPEPVMTSPTANTICSGSTPGVTFTANVAGGTFAWNVIGITSNVSGATVGNSGIGTSINQTLMNTSGSNGTVTYEVTPTGPNPNDCVGASQVVTITVISQPVMTSTNVNTICSDSAPTLAFATNITGSTYVWQVIAIGGSVGGTTIGSSGAGALSEVLTNTSGVNGTVTYRVTPTGPGPNNCVGASQDVTITVISKPVMTSASTNRICSGSAPSLVFSSNIIGSSYAWKVTGITGGVTGTSIGNAGTGNISDVLTNKSGATATVTYEVTPTGPAASNCIGVPQSVVVTVTPQPVITSPLTARICSGSTPASTLTFSSNVVGSTFAWQVTAMSASVTGTAVGSIGVGNIAHTLNNTSGSNGTVTYSVTPTGPSPDNCTGDTQIVIVTVVPQPAMTSASSKTICSGNTPGLTFTSNVSGATFAWEVINIAGTITGTVVGNVGTGDITQVLSNISGTSGSVTYRVTPTGPATDNCVGASQDVVITITPQPVMTSPATDNICSGNTPAVTFTSNVLGSTFAWTVTNVTGAVTGATVGNSGSGAITQTLVNVSNTSGTVTYRVIPTGPAPDHCPGVFQDLVVTVHPEPTAPLVTTITRCSKEALNFDLQTLINNSPAPVSSKFRYTVSVEPGPAASEVAISGLDRTTASTAQITDAFTHLAIASNADAVVVYTVTPFSNADNCPGTPFKLRVIVHPEPRGSAGTDALCTTPITGSSLNHNLSSQIVNGVSSKFTYQFIADPSNPSVVPTTPPPYDRTVASTANITDNFLNNTGNVAVVTYLVTPISTADNCAGVAFTYQVTINTNPVGTPTTITPACSNAGFTFNPQTVTSVASTFTWTVTYPTGLVVKTAGTGSGSISETLLNRTSGNTVLNAVYHVTPTAGSCIGTTFDITVPIKPEPVVASNLNETQCSGVVYGKDLATVMGGNASVAAGTYDITATVHPDLIGTATVGNGLLATALRNDAFINRKSTPLTVVYHVVPHATAGNGGCVGESKDVVFTINPEPVLSITPPPAVCSTNSNTINPINVVLGTDGTSVNANTYQVKDVQYSTAGTGGPFSTVLPADFTKDAANAALNTDGSFNLVKDDKYTNRRGGKVTVRYTIQGKSSGGCLSATMDFFIDINPEPILDPALSPTPICSGEKIDPAGTAFELRSIATSVPSTLFIIRSINTNGLTPALTNASLGIQINKDGIDNDSYTNTISPAFVNVVYTITPISADGCMGVDQTVTIRVNPAPGLKAGLDKLVCNNTNSGIVLVDDSPTSAPASQYRLAGITVGPANTPITPGATAGGLTANAGNRAIGATAGTSLISTDRYINNTSDRIVVRYQIVAIAATGCEATAFVTLTVEPAIISTSTITDPDICSGTPIAISFNTSSYANLDPTNPVITYSYSMTYAGPETSGISGNTVGNNLLKDASGTDISDVLVNSTNAAIQVKYRITPRAIGAAGGLGCAGTVQEILLTVQPRPKINPIADKTVCEDNSVNLSLVSPTTPSTGVIKFRLTSVVPETAAITGFTAANTLLANNTVLGDMLSNSDVVQRYVDYTFEPLNVDATDATICANGTPITVRVTVNPRPNVTPSATALEICSSESIEVNLVTDTDQSGTIVKWTALASSVDVVGESNGAGDLLFQTLINNGGAVQTVDYTVTPSFNGCDGPFRHIIVTVNPMPKFNSSPLPTLPNKITVCAGTTFNLNLAPLATGATTFRWEVTDVNGIGTVGQFDGVGTSISQVFVNTSDASATLLYQITPIFVSAGKQCEGLPRIVNVSVAPTITAAFISVDEGVCEGTPVFLTFELHGQAPFDFVYSATDATGTVNKTISKSGSVKVEKVTPTLTTVYKILSAKDALGCPVTFSPEPTVTITVYKKVTAGWTATIPPFIGGTSVVGFTNTSTPVDGAVFDYNWSFGTDGYVNPLSASGVGPFAVTYTRPGDHYVSLTASNKAAPVDLGCESTFAAKITIPVLPLMADFEFDPKAACFPTTIKVTKNTSTGAAMDWVVRDANNSIAATSNAPLPEFLITNPGKYTISLRTYDPFTHQEAFAPTAGKSFTIYDNPVASFDVRPTLVYVPDTELTTFNFTTGATEYLWDFGDGSTSTEQEPKYTYKIEGIYDITLVAINDHGDGAVCRDTLSRKITAKQGGVTKVPNAFTPSPNGPTGGVAGNNTFNDVFLPIVKGAEEFNMQVFDRWGNLIFESNNSNIGWDGYDKNGKLMPAGVYVYKLTVRLSDGQRSTQLGDITMIR